MIWEPCLDEICCPPLTRGGGMTVPELLPVKIWFKEEKVKKKHREKWHQLLCNCAFKQIMCMCDISVLTCGEPLLLAIVPRIRGGGADEPDKPEG